MMNRPVPSSLILLLCLGLDAPPAWADDETGTETDAESSESETLESDVKWWEEYTGETKVLSAAAQYEWGLSLIEAYRHKLSENPDPATLERLNEIARSILAQTGRNDIQPTVYISKEPVLNAYALPGGHVVFNQPMVDEFSDDELAYVMGHELAHLLLGHHARDLGRNQVRTEIDAIETFLDEQLREMTPGVSAERELAEEIPEEVEESVEESEESEGVEEPVAEETVDEEGDAPEPEPEAPADEGPMLREVVEIDEDGDGLDDRDETDILGTSPERVDSDNDDLGDYQEVYETQTDPTQFDTDGDQIGDGVEVYYWSTNPLAADTDGGGAPDGMELGPDQTNPNDPTDDLSNEQRTILVTREQTRDRLEGLASGLSSQYDELEADIYGMFWASAAGYPVSAAYSMDSKMLAAEVDYFDHSGAEDGTINQGENPFGSHPTTPRRLQQLRNAEILLKQYHGLYTAGQELCEGGSSETGIAAYERYLQAFPSDSSAQTNVGLCLLDDLVDDCASSGMKEVLPRALDNRLVLRGPGDGSSPFDDPSWRASWTKARGAFETALSIDRRNHIALAGLGLMARHEHHDEEALLLLNQAVLLAPEADSQVAGIQNNRGTILAALGRNEEAKQAFAEATRVNPSMTIAWNNWRTVVASEGSKRRLKKFDKMRASSSTEIATEGAAGNPEITDFKGMRPGGSEESLFEAFGESDRTNPIQQFERQHLWQNLDAENYEGPGLDVYVRGDRVTSLVVDMRPVIDPEAWTLSNGLKAKMSREQVVQLMGLPGGGEFTGGGASFRLAYVYPEHGLRILFNDRWQVSQVMLVATQLESDSMDTYLAELEARIESSKAALDQVCLKLQGVYEKEDDYVSWCMDWMQENVVYDFEDADWGTYGTCIETVTNDDEVISCICDSQDEYWQCQDLAEDSEE